jgi:tRNA pseudouridine38-40 synthase
MQNIKLIIQYDGTRYKGWQRLGDSGNTIQSKIENVLSRMYDQKIEITGSGRTDKGVHAYRQVANFWVENNKFIENEILEYCFEYLPDDIVVKSASIAETNFHSRYNAKIKKYLYRICNAILPDVFERKYSYHIPEKLDLRKMRTAAKALIGKHDFKSFTNLKSKKKSTVKEIFSIEIIQNNEYIEIILEADGFLQHMARIISGTLIETGLGKIKEDLMTEILKKKDRAASGFAAPARGLFLYEVIY